MPKYILKQKVTRIYMYSCLFSENPSTLYQSIVRTKSYDQDLLGIGYNIQMKIPKLNCIKDLHFKFSKQ